MTLQQRLRAAQLKLFLDDVRQPPDASWFLVRDPQLAYCLIRDGKVALASVDHDLGEGVATGYQLLGWLERDVVEGNVHLLPEVGVHSANPVGRARMLVAIAQTRRLLAARDDSHSTPTFLDRVCAGGLRLADVEDYVQVWHSGNDPRLLWDSLGLTQDEYDDWVRDPRVLARALDDRGGVQE